MWADRIYNQGRWDEGQDASLSCFKMIAHLMDPLEMVRFIPESVLTTVQKSAIYYQKSRRCL